MCYIAILTDVSNCISIRTHGFLSSITSSLLGIKCEPNFLLAKCNIMPASRDQINPKVAIQLISFCLLQPVDVFVKGHMQEQLIYRVVAGSWC